MVYIILFVGVLFFGKARAEGVVTLSGTDMCNGSVLLGAEYHAGIIDFRVAAPTLKPYSYVCNFHVETTNTPYIGMKFLSTFLDAVHDNSSQCSFELYVSGKVFKQKSYNSFPDKEININIHGYVDISITLNKCVMYSRNTSLFRLLVFKHGDTLCFPGEIKCVNSTRCVHKELTCDKLYDFCNNDFQNCQKNSGTPSYKRYRRRGPPSIPGILLGCICVTVLITFLIYFFLCRKRPCCERISRKLQCRLAPCQRCDDRGAERTTASAHFAREPEQVSLHYTRLPEPPPRYSDLHPSSNDLEQTGNVYPTFETGSRFYNIPPPLYSPDNTNEDEHVLNDLPPPYTALPSHTDGLQHM